MTPARQLARSKVDQADLALGRDDHEPHLPVHRQQRLVHNDALPARKPVGHLRNRAAHSGNLPRTLATYSFRTCRSINSSDRSRAARPVSARIIRPDVSLSSLFTASRQLARSKKHVQLTIALDVVVGEHDLQDGMAEISSRGMSGLGSACRARLPWYPKAKKQNEAQWAAQGTHHRTRLRHHDVPLLLVFVQYQDRIVRNGRFMTMHSVAVLSLPLTTSGREPTLSGPRSVKQSPGSLPRHSPSSRQTPARVSAVSSSCISPIPQATGCISVTMPFAPWPRPGQVQVSDGTEATHIVLYAPIPKLRRHHLKQLPPDPPVLHKRLIRPPIRFLVPQTRVLAFAVPLVPIREQDVFGLMVDRFS